VIELLVPHKMYGLLAYYIESVVSVIAC